MAITGRTADNQDRMNAFGVGVSVALGWAIGGRLAVPDCYFQPLLMGMVWWGFISGLIFHLYRVALRGVRLPFGRR